MLISVIVPTYRFEDYLWACLDSLLQQTLDKNKFEVVIVLNGDKEPYWTRLLLYQDAHRSNINLNIIYTSSLGVSNARNVGIDSSEGKYIAFIDDDDYVSPIYLEEMLKIAKKGYIPLTNMIAFDDKEGKQVDYVVTRQYQKRQNTIRLSQYRARAYFSIPVCKLISKEVIGSTRFNCKFHNSEDALFMLAISNRIHKMKFTDSAAVYYRRVRINSANMRQRSVVYMINNGIDLLVEILKIWCKNPCRCNFMLFVTRPLAVFKGMCYSVFRLM